MLPLSLRQNTHIAHAYRHQDRRNRNRVRRSFAFFFFETPYPALVGSESALSAFQAVKLAPLFEMRQDVKSTPARAARKTPAGSKAAEIR
jgi:hypothetical protein